MKKFMRTRPAALPAPPPATRRAPPAAAAPVPAPAAAAAFSAAHNTHHKTNGHANGVGGGARRDDHSTLSSRYWSGSGGSASGAGGALWEDPDFPATWRSIGDKRLAADVVWMRPHELCTRPTFLGEPAEEARGVSGEPEPPDEFAARWCITVGEAGDAHVCAAAAALALTPRLLARVAPPHSFRRRYCGAFRFRFWVFGQWREVTVDDRLPTRAGRLLASTCSLPADFTLPLLEKAYAKLYGSYAALRGGNTARALQDLSGGIVQSFSLARQPRALTFQVLNSAVPRSSLLVATVQQEKEARWRRLRNGLIAGQAYCVTGLARVRGVAGVAGNAAGGGAEGALVRVRAPGGRGEWSGAWARGSAEWRALADGDRDLLAHRATHPGEFWMSFADFSASFSRLELVHVGPDDWLAERALHAKRPWRAVLARRRWRTGYNAGGPPHCTETAGTNPQFHVQVPRNEGGARKCHVVVSVTQQYACAGACHLRAIGFAVYELAAGAGATGSARRALDVTHESRAREVVTFFTLPPGEYVVVPHTRRPHTDAAFLLRILTDEQTNIWEVNEDNVIVRDILSEFMNERRPVPAETRATLVKLLGKPDIEEVDAGAVRAALRRVWRRCLCARPSLELCRALVMLRDAPLAGRMPAADLPPLVALLAFWKHTYVKYGAGARAGRCGGGACSAYRLRALLRAAGLTASNKVLECLVLRFARGAALSAEAYVMALARLHLAHERYRSLDAKMKSNPLSLEEMILMTIYS